MQYSQAPPQKGELAWKKGDWCQKEGKGPVREKMHGANNRVLGTAKKPEVVAGQSQKCCGEEDNRKWLQDRALGLDQQH